MLLQADQPIRLQYSPQIKLFTYNLKDDFLKNNPEEVC